MPKIYIEVDAWYPVYMACVPEYPHEFEKTLYEVPQELLDLQAKAYSLLNYVEKTLEAIKEGKELPTQEESDSDPLCLGLGMLMRESLSWGKESP